MNSPAERARSYHCEGYPSGERTDTLPPMKVSIKTPTLDLEVDDVKKLEEVLEFIAGLKKLEAETEKPNTNKRRPLKTKDEKKK